MYHVYKLFFASEPDLVYIGSSKYVQNRRQQHFKKLRDNNHDNKDLQNKFNEYGEDHLRFEILECVEDIRVRERHHILQHISEHGKHSVFNKVLPVGKTNTTLNRQVNLYCVELKKLFATEKQFLEFMYLLGIDNARVGSAKHYSSYRSFTWVPYTGQEITETFDRDELALQAIRQYLGKRKVGYSKKYNILVISYIYERQIRNFELIFLTHKDLLDEKYINLLEFNPYEIADKSGLL